MEEKEIEIDLLELGKKLWDNKKFIIKVTIIGAIVGLVIAFSIPKEYTSTVVLTPEVKKGGIGSLGSLATLAGINLGGSVGEDVLGDPRLYPEVLKSTSFISRLLSLNVVDSTQNVNTSLREYLLNNQSVAWWSYVINSPSLILNIFKSDEAVEKKKDGNSRNISKEEISAIKSLRNRMFIDYDKNIGLSSISVTMQSAEISALLADSITSYLQSYIIDYRTKKAKEDLQYTERLYDESQSSYYDAQSALAVFRDANMNVVSAKYKTNEERLQNEVNLTYSIYNQMAQQLQMAKIKVQDLTPVFAIIQPAIQPIIPSKPHKKIIVGILIFVSLLGSIIWILKEDLLKF